MKKIIMFISLALLASSCQKEQQDNPTPDQFVAMLIDGSYDSYFLPDFKPEDIEQLLTYSNDFRMIDKFPVNPLSSMMAPEFRLGECLLWTIESIRLNYDKTSSYAKFPSLMPQLVIPDDTYEQAVASTDDLNRAYNLYLSWWTNNKSRYFEEFRYINPLHDAVLIWR